MITFFEYGNTVIFNAHDIPRELSDWEENVAAGDIALYHDSEHGTRPHGKIVSVSPDRKYLLLRLAGYEKFAILRKINQDEYIVMKSDISAMLETTGKLYYGGAVGLQNVYWEQDPEQRTTVVFLWYHYEEHRMFADFVTLNELPAENGKELVDFVSGRYTVSEDS